MTRGGEARRRSIEDARLGFGGDKGCDNKLRASGDWSRPFIGLPLVGDLTVRWIGLCGWVGLICC